MAKFKVQRQATVWYEIIIQAENAEEANRIARDNKMWLNSEIAEGSDEWADDSLLDLWVGDAQ